MNRCDFRGGKRERALVSNDFTASREVDGRYMYWLCDGSRMLWNASSGVVR